MRQGKERGGRREEDTPGGPRRGRGPVRGVTRRRRVQEGRGGARACLCQTSGSPRGTGRAGTDCTTPPAAGAERVRPAASERLPRVLGSYLGVGPNLWSPIVGVAGLVLAGERGESRAKTREEEGGSERHGRTLVTFRSEPLTVELVGHPRASPKRPPDNCSYPSREGPFRVSCVISRPQQRISNRVASQPKPRRLRNPWTRSVTRVIGRLCRRLNVTRCAVSDVKGRKVAA